MQNKPLSQWFHVYDENVYNNVKWYKLEKLNLIKGLYFNFFLQLLLIPLSCKATFIWYC